MKINKQMSKSTVFFVFTIIFCAMIYQAKAGTTTWTGTNSTSWSNAGNWTTSGGSTPPSSSDDVVITSQTNEPTFDVSGGATIGSLTINSSSTLTLDGTNPLTVSGNTSVGSGGLLITSSSTYTTDSITGSGELTALGATIHIKGNLSISSYSSYSYSGSPQSKIIFDGAGPQNIAGCLPGTGTVNLNINLTSIEIANQYYPVTTTANIQFNIMTIDAGAEFEPGAAYKVYADNEIQNILVYGKLDVTYCNVSSTDDLSAQYWYGYSDTKYAIIQYYGQGTLKFAGTAQQEAITTYNGRAGVSNSEPINMEIANTSDTVRLTVLEAVTNNLTVDAGAVLRLGATATITAANIIVNGTARVSRVSNTSDGFTEQFIATSSYTLTNATLLFVGASAQMLGDHNFKNLTVNTTSGGLTLTGTSGMTVSGNLTGTGTLYGGSDNITVDGTFSVSTFTANTSTVILGGTSNLGAYTFDNLTINGTVTLTGNIIVTGNLAGSGTLIPDSYSVTVDGNTTIASITTGSGTTTVSGTSPSINSQTFYNLTLNDTTTATLSGNITVNGALTLTKGKINLGNYKLTIGPSGSISGFSSTRYIYTNGNGTVEMTVTSAGVTFQIGDDYNPITIMSLSGTAVYDVNVSNGVTDQTNTAITSNAVNVTWTISVTSGSQTVKVIPQWDAAEQLTGFTGNNINVATRTSLLSAWVSTEAATIASGTGPYTLTSGAFTISAGNTYYIGIGNNLSPLPVSLVSFNATHENNQVDLAWQTASEINNDYFGIERSLDGQSWESIGQVPGHGNSQDMEYYNYTDNLTGVVPSGTFYYRLKQVDFNGKFEYSMIRSVSLNGTTGFASMYPNPATNVLNLNWTNSDNNNVVLKLINTTGTIIYSKDVSGQGLKSNQIDLSNFASGTYILQIVSDEDVISKMVYKE